MRHMKHAGVVDNTDSAGAIFPPTAFPFFSSLAGLESPHWKWPGDISKVTFSLLKWPATPPSSMLLWLDRKTCWSYSEVIKKDRKISNMWLLIRKAVNEMKCYKKGNVSGQAGGREGSQGDWGGAAFVSGYKDCVINVIAFYATAHGGTLYQLCCSFTGCTQRL